MSTQRLYLCWVFCNPEPVYSSVRCTERARTLSVQIQAAKVVRPPVPNQTSVFAVAYFCYTCNYLQTELLVTKYYLQNYYMTAGIDCTISLQQFQSKGRILAKEVYNLSSLSFSNLAHRRFYSHRFYSYIPNFIVQEHPIMPMKTIVALLDYQGTVYPQLSVNMILRSDLGFEAGSRP